MPRAPHCPVYHALSLRVADYLLFGRVKFDLAAKLHGNISQVGDRDSALGVLDGRDGLLAGADAVDEVPIMVI